jgi:hypothetical protein
MLRFIMLTVIGLVFPNAECLHDGYCSCSVFMPCVVMLNVILIDFTMLSINVSDIILV